MRIVSIINQKGGCGKTTTAINLAGIMARRGYRTLLVDLDPQSHCAAGLAIPEQRIDQDIGDAMLVEPASALNPQRLLWRVSRNLDLAPSRMRLAGLEAPRGGLAEKADKERRLANVLATLSRNYDLCLIDCSPSIGLLTYNALAAATDVLIPVETSFFALQGASKQVNTIKTMARRLGASPRYWLVGTIHDESSVLSRDLLTELRRRFESRVAPTVIRRDMTLKESASFGQPVVEYNPEAAGAQDYQSLAEWLLGVIGLAPGTTPLAVPDLPDEEEAQSSAEAADSEADSASAGEAAAEPATTEPLTPGVVSLSSRVEEMAAMARAMLMKTANGGDAIPSASPATAGAGTAVMEREPSGSTLVAAPVRRSPLVLLEDEPASVPPVAEPVQTFFGVRQTRQGTLFVQPLSLGKRLAIAGDFNNWSATSHPMRRNDALGVWELCVPLPPGKRLYRLVVDGRWVIDPSNARSEPNPYHELNSVVEVSATV